MRWKKLLGATLLLCFSQAPAVAAPVDDFIRAEMKRLNIPGLSLAVIKDRKIVKLTGYGMANLETQTPATPDTVYKIASLSKPILAAGILLLARHQVGVGGIGILALALQKSRGWNAGRTQLAAEALILLVALLFLEMGAQRFAN